MQQNKTEYADSTVFSIRQFLSSEFCQRSRRQWNSRRMFEEFQKPSNLGGWNSSTNVLFIKNHSK